MPETPEDAALIEAVADTAFGFVDEDNIKAAARVLSVVRAHDASAQAAEITALRAERDALAARLAVPGEMDQLVRYHEGAAEWDDDKARRRQAKATVRALTALRARVAGLEGALTTLQAGDCPRPLGKRWRADGVPSTYDRCIHGAMMNEPCETCADAFISAALSPSAAQEARDAETDR